MADEPQAVSGSEEEPKEADKRPKVPKPKFGRILSIGGQFWTVQEAENGTVTVSRKVGDTFESRQLSSEEYERAAAVPLPANLAKQKPPKGIAVGSYYGGGVQGAITGRVLAYDAVTGDAQIDSPERGVTTASVGSGATLPKPGAAPARPGRKPQGSLVDRWVRRQLSDVSYGAIPAEREAPKAASGGLKEKKERVKKKKGEETEEEAAPSNITVKVEKHDTEKDEYLITLRDPETGEIERRWVDGAFARANLRRIVSVPAGEAREARETMLEPRELRDISEHMNPRRVTKADLESVKKEAAGRVERERPAEEEEEVAGTIQEAEAPKAAPTKPAASVAAVAPTVAVPPAVVVSRTMPVGKATAAATPVSPAPSIRETRAELKAQVESVKPTEPGAFEIRAGVAIPPPPTSPAAAVLGVTGAVLGALGVEAKADARRAADQQALYAHATHALEIVQTRAAERRKSVQDLQTQADALRQEIAGLNAQAAAPSTGAYRAPADVAPRIQAASQELGAVQNKLAMARYGLQTDEAQAQQLRIATNMMKNLAPEMREGRVPQAIVGLVAQSIPPDVPAPSPARAAVLVTAVQPGAAPPPLAEAPPVPREAPTPRSFAAAPPSRTERPTPPTGALSTVAEDTRARLSRGGVPLPQATAVALSAGQQADRAAALGYQEGLGAPDARMAAFAQEGAGARPVIETIPASYTEPGRVEEAEDIYQPGGETASAEFAEEQRRLFAAQEQFLPGTTGGPQPTEFVPETVRAQRVRPEPEGPDEEALRAAAYQAQIAQARAAALQAYDVEREEEEETGLKRIEKLRAQVESVKRNYSRLFDLFNGALGAATAPTVIGAILEALAILGNANGRMIVAFMTYRKKNSMIRKLVPPAQIPVEVAFIAVTDILVVSVVFFSTCVLLAPFIIFWVLTATGVSAILWAIL